MSKKQLSIPALPINSKLKPFLLPPEDYCIPIGRCGCFIMIGDNKFVALPEVWK